VMISYHLHLLTIVQNQGRWIGVKGNLISIR
jgi:hypothetical protein